MSKQAWIEHMRGLGLVTSGLRSDPRTTEALAHMRSGCAVCSERKRTRRANMARLANDSARRMLGLKRTPYGWE